MRPSAVLQHIQHIASLGLPDGIAIPEILATVQEAVPAAYASFYWIDPVGNTKDYYAPPAVIAEMARHSVDFLSLDPDDEPTLHKVVATGRTVDNASLMGQLYDLSRSVMIHEVMPTMSAATGMDLVVRRDGEACGVLYLNRRMDDPAFTSADRRFLSAIHPYVAHAVCVANDVADGALDPEAEREGSVTVTMGGEILSSAGDALAMLADIPQPRREWRQIGDFIHGHLPSVLFPVLEALAQTGLGRPAPPARMTLHRTWGEFRVRAYALRNQRGEPDGTATVILSHHLPREVRMLRRIAAMPLTPMERRVAFLAGQGRAPASMANILGIGETTLRGYLKSAYARTGAQGREDLAARVRGA